MEARSRSFEPVRLGIINVEIGSERFDEDNSHSTPKVAFWRVNLTALSQRHNLYFVATRDRVQVYRPDFPYQALGDKPVLTIIPQVSRSEANGYIDPGRPHDVNHLIVGDLGHQEILLLSTDSGNVLAYNTSSINAAIKQDAYTFSTDANADFVGVRPFFSQWVHESAWGLAIHKDGRMIAISANKPQDDDEFDFCSKITVFAFALTPSDQFTFVSQPDTEDDADLEDDPSSEWKLWSTSASKLGENGPKRDCNYKIVLAGIDGHKDNIPCVTFVNSTEDKTGSWLLSTDIRGRMKMWQIWKGKCVKTWYFGNHTSTPWTLSPEAGWLVAAFDLNAFRPAEDMESFIGHHRARQFYGYNAPGDSYDLTDVVQRYTPQNSSVHPTFGASGRSSSDEHDEVEQDEFNANMEDSGDEVADLPASNAMTPLINPVDDQLPEMQPGFVPYDEEMILVDSDDEIENGIHDGLDEDGMQFDITENLSDVADGEEVSSGEHDNYPSNDGSMSATSSFSDDQRNSDESEPLQEHDGTVDNGFLTPPPSTPRRRKIKPIPVSKIRRLQSDERVHIPLVPILHCSTSHVRLLSGPDANQPHIFCARMLRQTLPVDLENRAISHMDRINMLHQIPELGIVLIATQLGRCAICTLTRRKQDGLFGFRVDWIVPTKSQERSGARPRYQPLLGIASSPIQGHVPPESRSVFNEGIYNDWSSDRVIDGTLTTFDPEIVVLQTEFDSHKSDQERMSSTSNAPNNHAEKRRWETPAPAEHWTSHESSRRYRIMLTYTDMTVLTYEISKGIDRGNITTH